MSNQVSCCVVDLETTNLSADFGILLCGVVKGSDQRRSTVFRGDKYPSWKSRRSDDKAIVQDVVTEMAAYDIWIIHNVARFDCNFLRTRLLRWGLDPLPTRKLIDPVLIARNKLRMSFNGLNALANHLGCNTKTDVNPDAWLRASLDGDRKSMDYIVQHCVQDVLTLEKVAGALKVYSTTYNSYGSGF